jgi:hypothetical protein
MLAEALRRTTRTLGRTWWRTALLVLLANVVIGIVLTVAVFALLSDEDPTTSTRLLEQVSPGLLITALLGGVVQLFVLSLSIRIAGTREPIGSSFASAVATFWRFALVSIPAFALAFVIVVLGLERSWLVGSLFAALWSVPLAVLVVSVALERSRWGVDLAWRLGIARGEKLWAFAHSAIVAAACAAVLALAGLLLGGILFPDVLADTGPLGVFGAGGLIGSTLAAMIVAPFVVAAAVTTFELLEEAPRPSFDDDDDEPGMAPLADDEYVDIVARLQHHDRTGAAAPPASQPIRTGLDPEVPVSSAALGSVEDTLPDPLPAVLGPGQVVRGRWATTVPLPDVSAAWKAAAMAFPTTGLWPVVVTDEIADGNEHLWDAEPSPVPEDGRAVMVAFVARELAWMAEQLTQYPDVAEGSHVEALGLTPGDAASAIDAQLLDRSSGRTAAPYSSAPRSSTTPSVASCSSLHADPQTSCRRTSGRVASTSASTLRSSPRSRAAGRTGSGRTWSARRLTCSGSPSPGHPRTPTRRCALQPSTMRSAATGCRRTPVTYEITRG